MDRIWAKIIGRKVKKVIKKHGWKIGAFIISWEICSHVVFPVLTANFLSPWVAWIWYTPIDEFIVYPVVFAFVAKA